MFHIHTISKFLPDEIIDYISEYNPEHREKMKAVLEDICYVQNCYTCHKRIIGYVWSMRGGFEECCSQRCLDKLYCQLH